MALEHDNLEEETKVLRNKLNSLNLSQQETIKLSNQEHLSIRQKDEAISHQES